MGSLTEFIPFTLCPRNEAYRAITITQFSQAAEGGAWRTVRTIGRCVGGLRCTQSRDVEIKKKAEAINQ